MCLSTQLGEQTVPKRSLKNSEVSHGLIAEILLSPDSDMTSRILEQEVVFLISGFWILQLHHVFSFPITKLKQMKPASKARCSPEAFVRVKSV